MQAFSLDDIAHRLFDSVPQGLSQGLHGMRQDLEANFRVVLRNSLGKLDVVTRDEFDVQAKVLERTRARLAELEARVLELEQKLTGGGTAG